MRSERVYEELVAEVDAALVEPTTIHNDAPTAEEGEVNDRLHSG